MTILTPDTNSIQVFKVRTRPASNTLPLYCTILLTDQETGTSSTVIPYSAEFDASEFMIVSSSFNLTPNHYYTMQIMQWNDWADESELYRGEIYATTESSTIKNSEPLQSYTSGSNDYIFYEK